MAFVVSNLLARSSFFLKFPVMKTSQYRFLLRSSLAMERPSAKALSPKEIIEIGFLVSIAKVFSHKSASDPRRWPSQRPEFLRHLMFPQAHHSDRRQVKLLERPALLLRTQIRCDNNNQDHAQVLDSTL